MPMKPFLLLMKILLLIIFFKTAIPLKGQTIKSSVFGQNAWYINVANLNPSADIPWSEVEASGVKYVRIGGIEPNFFPMYTWDVNDLSITLNSEVQKLTSVIDKIREYHMEPIVQVGYDPLPACTTAGAPTQPLNGLTRTQQATIAGNLVGFLKNYYSINKIKYWVIANEPNHGKSCGTQRGEWGGYSWNTSSDAVKIAEYIKEFSVKMKTADEDIKIMGPELNYYDPNIMNKLLNGGTSAENITGSFTIGSNTHYYIDYVTFHYYPFASNSIGSRTDVITNLRNANQFSARIQEVKDKFSVGNPLAHRTLSNLGIGITEANLNYLSSNGQGSPGLSSETFLGGQFWAEMMSIAMEKGIDFLNFWSIKEGGLLSYINSNNEKRPSYHHFSMIANNFKGTYYPSTASPTNLKAFASKSSNEVVVMLLNQNTSTQTYTIDLNSTTNGTIRFSTGIVGTFQCEIAGEATSLLRFDLSGTLIQHTSYSINDPAPSNFTYNHSTTYNNYTVSGTETWNTSRSLKGTLTVNGTLNIIANLEVAPGAIIIVNGVLNVSNNAFIKPIGNCPGPWEGLQVNYNGAYNMDESTVEFKQGL